jgi:hypothetical protein
MNIILKISGFTQGRGSVRRVTTCSTAVTADRSAALLVAWELVVTGHVVQPLAPEAARRHAAVPEPELYDKQFRHLPSSSVGRGRRPPIAARSHGLSRAARACLQPAVRVRLPAHTRRNRRRTWAWAWGGGGAEGHWRWRRWSWR